MNGDSNGREPGTGSRQPGTANGEGGGGDWRSELRGALIGLVIAAVILGGGWVAGNRETTTTYGNGNDDGLWGGGKVLVADWVVSGAGDASYNGDYSEAGSYGGKPYYVGPSPANNRYLHWAGAWVLSGSMDPPDPNYYIGTGADLPANPWTANGEITEPAPTVSAASPGPDGYASIGTIRAQLVAHAGGTINGIRATLRSSGSPDVAQAALYDDTDDSLVAVSEEITVGDAGAYTFVFASPPNAGAGDYHLAVWGASGVIEVAYDVGSDAYGHSAGATYDTWPDPASWSAFVGWAYRIELAPVVAGTAALSDARLVAVAGDADLSDARLVRVGGGAALSDDRNLVGDTLYGQFPLSDARLVRVANSSALSDARLVRVSGGAALSDARPTHRLGGRWRLSDDRQVAVSGSALLSDARTVGVSGRARMSDARLVAVSGGALLSDDREAPPGGTSSLATMLLLMARRRR